MSAAAVEALADQSQSVSDRLNKTCYCLTLDREALYTALKEKWIAGAGLEVTEPEPLPADSALRELHTIIIVPHTAGYSEEAMVDLRTKTAQGVVEVLKGNMPQSLVNRNVLHKLPVRD